MHCREKRRLPDLSGVRNEVRNGIFNPWISSVKQIHCELSLALSSSFIIFHPPTMAPTPPTPPTPTIRSSGILAAVLHLLHFHPFPLQPTHSLLSLLWASYASFKLGFSKSNLQEKSIRKASEKPGKKYIPTGVRRDHELRSEICDRVPLNGGHVDKSQVEDCTAVPWCTVQCSERTPWHLTQLDRKKDCSCQLCRWNQCRDLSKKSNSKPFIS